MFFKANKSNVTIMHNSGCHKNSGSLKWDNHIWDKENNTHNSISKQEQWHSESTGKTMHEKQINNIGSKFSTMQN